MKIKYNGIEFKHGDEILFRLRQSTFIKGKICITHGTPLESETFLNEGTFYLCHNNELFKGADAPNKLGFSFSWVVNIYDNIITASQDRSLDILPLMFETINLKLSKKFSLFLSKEYPNLFYLFGLKLDPLERCTEIIECKDGFVEIVNENNKRVTIKLGRLIRKLINNFNEIIPATAKIEYSDQLIEVLHNKWSSFTCEITFAIKNGESIIKEGYNSNSYHKGGSLHSCMTNKEKELEFYSDNPNQINIIIFYFEGQLCGRSILWKCTDDKWYHDRLYTSFDWIRPAIVQILEEKNIETLFGKKEKYVVKVDNMEHTIFPYLDSLRHINKKEKMLSNIPFDIPKVNTFDPGGTMFF